MADRPAFEPLRDRSFEAVLARAFKVFPIRAREILRAEEWRGFHGFMAAVAHAGQVLLTSKHPRMQTIQERGMDVEIQRLLEESNTDAMMAMLSGAFFGGPGVEPDPELARQALESQDIKTWKEMAYSVLTGALRLYSHVTGGGSPLDGAKPAVLAIAQIDPLNLDERKLPLVVESFGLSSPMHLEALLASFFSAETTVEDLEGALRAPERLTAILAASPSNPHKGLTFGKRPGTELSGPRPSYPEEIRDSGIPAITNRQAYTQAVRRWGPPNAVSRPGAEVTAIFQRENPDVALVFVDDDRKGRWVGVWVPRKSSQSPEMKGQIPDNPAAVMWFKDLLWPENSAGNLVAVSKFDWQNPRLAVIEGWRGPGKESEDFAKNQLELFACADMKVDGEGYWLCVRRW